MILVALATAMTLVPALLALAGRRLVQPGLAGRVPGLRLADPRTGDVRRGGFVLPARRPGPAPPVAGHAGHDRRCSPCSPRRALHLQLRNSTFELLPLRLRPAGLPARRSPTSTRRPVGDRLGRRRGAARRGHRLERGRRRPGRGRLGRPAPGARPVRGGRLRVDTADQGGPAAVAAVKAIRALDAPFPHLGHRAGREPDRLPRRPARPAGLGRGDRRRWPPSSCCSS